MDKKTVLIVDDESSIRSTLRLILQAQYSCLEACTLQEAEKIILKEELDLILLDIRIGDESGIDLLKFLNKNGLSRPVVCISGEASYLEAIEAYKFGAVDFLEKPLSQQKLFVSISKCIAQHELKERQRTFLKSFGQTNSRLIGSSAPIEELHEQIKSVAASDAKILILGETGTGKEAVASLVHNNSKRIGNPFIVVDCGSLPQTLMESTLFGHRKGAFTSANEDQAGRLECAHGGTLFLDEIGELTLEGQNRLLRFLETGEFQRIGASKVQKVNTRVIAATSRNIDQLIREGKFRSDLYFRLNVITLKTPALRDIQSDIVDIFEYHFSHFCSDGGRTAEILTEGAKNSLRQYSWPGNVRELRNLAERAAILGLNRALSSIGGDTEKPLDIQLNVTNLMPLKEFRHQQEKHYIKKVLDLSKNNITHAARVLGIDRVSLHQKIVQYGLK